jgi:hypothetical protein
MGIGAGLHCPVPARVANPGRVVAGTRREEAPSDGLQKADTADLVNHGTAAVDGVRAASWRSTTLPLIVAAILPLRLTSAIDKLPELATLIDSYDAASIERRVRQVEDFRLMAWASWKPTPRKGRPPPTVSVGGIEAFGFIDRLNETRASG